MRILVLFILISTSGSTTARRHGIGNNAVVGYDISKISKRLNEQVSEWGKSLIECDVHVRLVIRDDYETISAVSLNTFMESTELSYYILQSNSVEIQFFDVSNHFIRSVTGAMCNLGHHMLFRDATVNAVKTVPTTIEFVSRPLNMRGSES